MARETRAQRLEREAAERAAYEAEQSATYPQRLMAMLERACKANYELAVKDSLFVVRDRDSDWDERYKLDIHYTADYNSTLDALECSVQIKEEAEREAERRAAVLRAARAKLTPEELELLLASR
jgi:hypothetical protein